MKKPFLYFIFFYFFFNIEGKSASSAVFKPFSDIDIFIGAPADKAYKSLKNYLDSNFPCSVNFGKYYEKNEIINISISEDEILNYASSKKSKAMFYCNKFRYESLNDASFNFDTCNGIINRIHIYNSTLFGINKDPLNSWLSYFRKFSSKKPKSQITERTALIGTEEVVFESELKTWADSEFINGKEIGVAIHSSVEVEKKTKRIIGHTLNFSQITMCRHSF